MPVPAVKNARPRGSLAQRCLYGQAWCTGAATAVGVYLAVATANDIRQTGMSSIQGLTVSGCTLFAICAAVATVALGLSAVGLRQYVPAARWVGLLVQAVVTAALLATVRHWFGGNPIGVVIWLLMFGLAVGTAWGIRAGRRSSD